MSKVVMSKGTIVDIATYDMGKIEINALLLVYCHVLSLVE